MRILRLITFAALPLALVAAAFLPRVERPASQAIADIGPAASTGAMVNLALPAYGTRITADSQYGDHVGPRNLADGRTDTGFGCWFSRDHTPLPCAVTFTFAHTERIRGLRLYQAVWSGSMYHTRDFAVEVSSNGTEWTRIATGSLPDQNGAHCDVACDATGRYLRVVVLTSYIAFQTCGFAEIEIAGERPVAFGSARLLLNGVAPTISRDFAESAFAFAGPGAQALVERVRGVLTVSLIGGETASLVLPVAVGDTAGEALASMEVTEGSGVRAVFAAGGARRSLALGPNRRGGELEAPLPAGYRGEVQLQIHADSPATVRVSDLRAVSGAITCDARLDVSATEYGSGPPPQTPPLRPGMERAMVELDWHAQDGIGTSREPRDYPEAIRALRAKGDALARKLGERSALTRRWSALAASGDGSRRAYLAMRRLKREMLLTLAGRLPPIVFAKQVPSCFSHQLTQYYGRYARPGGGIYILERPGIDMGLRSLTDGRFALGSFAFPEVSWNADRILFAFVQAETTPDDTIQGARGRYYHLYAISPGGAGLRRLTDGPFDDFTPRFLPDDRMVFISTRRGGWHRCGTPGCENYVLTTANADGSGIQPISFHETQEWDPAVLNDGRIIYTRWDYVDRHPVFYEHLWTTAPDGARAAALFGNNTFNPVGIWEARPIPGSRRILATAAAHHAMTAGSIIRLDPAAGVDGPIPLTRLTPETPFPESETRVTPSWYAPTAGVEARDSEENRRWPGHTYRSPYPLSENLFLAAYSYEQLVGEPQGNPANMFGLYLCDSDGNRELLYRDPSIASLWPVPLTPRSRPRPYASTLDPSLGDNGVYVVQNVYASQPALPPGSVKALRIVQVLPKSTPGKDLPPIGVPSGAPGKQVLGTVPVEKDGSAHFIVPARKELAFQALDDRGMAVQIMRSGAYLQPGERMTCIGCHESRTTAPPSARPLAQLRPPSRITPGPDGSKPLSYTRLVQKVLDDRCVSCHSGKAPSGGVDLTGTPEGHYTRSYLALVRQVPFSDMENGEALSKPGRYGSTASPLMKKLLAGHQGVKLTPSEIERLATWMDVSALFYGTFDSADQERQKAGLPILKPVLE